MTRLRYVESRTHKLVAETMSRLAWIAGVSVEELVEMSAAEFRARCEGRRVRA